MRYRWLMLGNVIAGLLLIVAPFVERFAMDRPALYTDVGVGILLLIWALLSSLSASGLMGGRIQRTHA